MRKILVIIYQSLYNTYSDRNLLLIMLAAPLALSTIIGLAFGGAGNGDVSIENIPVVIVNLDTPAEGKSITGKSLRRCWCRPPRVGRRQHNGRQRRRLRGSQRG
ncbi:MAG: hypothetical protein U0694_05875 [Anaerolineae bacterium]